jgi:hypothetical protein
MEQPKEIAIDQIMKDMMVKYQDWLPDTVNAAEVRDDIRSLMTCLMVLFTEMGKLGRFITGIRGKIAEGESPVDSIMRIMLAKKEKSLIITPN